MNNIHILYVGNENWTERYTIPEFIEWEIFTGLDKLPKDQLDIVILDRIISPDEENKLARITRAYSLFATENVNMEDVCTSRYFERRSGIYICTEDMQDFLDNEAEKYYKNPYGEKFRPENLSFSQFFEGRISCRGNYDTVLEGDFGDEFTQIAYWKSNIPIFEKQNIDLYFEHIKTGTVEVELKVYKFYNGSVGDIQRVWKFDNNEVNDIITLKNDEIQGPLFVSVLARGQGSLEIISLHDRHSRDGIGYFLPGGDRIVSSRGEELFAYFDKGDLKPPLAIYFSGYRRQEGFEGYNMMRKLGCPVMLVTDPRLEGGAFYIENSDLEGRMLEYFNSKINELGFTNSDVIISGGSMGTFGSLYYASMILPHALILAKPLTELGVVAENERINRPGVFPTSLDLLMKNYGSLSIEAKEQFDGRMWEKFDKADWSNTKFIISYLYEDDYDTDGYQNILRHLESEGVQVYGKGTHGHHMDNHMTVMAWYKSQYDLMLEEDFNRK